MFRISFLRPYIRKLKPGDSFFSAQWRKRIVKGENKSFNKNSEGAIRLGRSTAKEDQDDKA